MAKLQESLAAANNELEEQSQKAKQREQKYKATIEQWKTQYGGLRDRLVQTADTLRATSNEQQQTSEKLTAVTENFKTCYTDNHELVSINEKLLAAYNNKGVWSALKQAEPVTGFGKVDTENLLQKYRHAIEDRDLSSNQ